LILSYDGRFYESCEPSKSGVSIGIEKVYYLKIVHKVKGHKEDYMRLLSKIP